MTQAFFQIEQGYTKIPNSILRAGYKTAFNGTEFRVIYFVIRMTLGWNKESKPISYSFIAKETGLDKRNVRRAVSLLIRANVIIKSKAGRKNVLGINQNCVCWELWKTRGTTRARTPLLEGVILPLKRG